MTPMIPGGVVQLMDSTSGFPVILHLHRNPEGSAEEFEWRPEAAGRYVFPDFLDADKAAPLLLANERERRKVEGRAYGKLQCYPFVLSGSCDVVPRPLVPVAKPEEMIEVAAAPVAPVLAIEDHTPPRARRAKRATVGQRPVRLQGAGGAGAWRETFRQRIEPAAAFEQAERRCGS